MSEYNTAKFLRNAWYMAGWITDFPQGVLTSVQLLNEPIVIYQQDSGQWAALEDMCCHRLVPLSMGRLEGNDVRCMYHGIKFGPDGKCVEIPCQERISPSVRVKSYPIEQKHGALWIWMGLPERADSSRIPPIPGTDDPQLSVGTAVIDIEGNASLIWDNLMDLTHIPFTHANSFGGGDAKTNAISIAAETQNMAMEILENGIRSSRWHEGKPKHSFLGIPCDEFVSNDFIAPGVLLVKTLSYNTGIKQRYPDDIPDEELLSTRVACQVVTPLSESMAKIYFNVGATAKFKEFIPGFLDVAKMALNEDKAFIDAQQTKMREHPHKQAMMLSMDTGVMKFTKVMERLLQEDQAIMAKGSTKISS